ncbi:MAG: FAD-dependent oxidoreductase [Acutalibacteraceae bacterium]
MNSIWPETSHAPEFEALKGDAKTDVLIIGGGIAGILCAYMLRQAGVGYMLVESDRICNGITRNTTAKITAQHGLIYDKLIREFGVEAARMYLEANLKAVEKYSELCREIDCDFEKKDSFVYSVDKPQKIENEFKALEKIGFAAEFSRDLPLPVSTVGAVKFRDQAQFNPLKFLYAVAGNLNIYENTKVLAFEQNKAITNGGKISAEKIIVATHFPFLNKHGAYFFKLYQSRSYVIALKSAQNVDGIYVDESGKGLSFRNYKDLLLLGGSGNRTGKKSAGWQELHEFARENYPDSKEVRRWATQDCMSLDAVPYIGQYSQKTPNLYVATGFNKWGMSCAMVSASILSDMILGKENEYAKVFSPSRTVLRPQLAVNAAEAIVNLITPTVPRCPHMGCALKYNKAEHSWDCPCHGSRFAGGGKLLDNPATADKKGLKNK